MGVRLHRMICWGAAKVVLLDWLLAPGEPPLRVRAAQLIAWSSVSSLLVSHLLCRSAVSLMQNACGPFGMGRPRLPVTHAAGTVAEVCLSEGAKRGSGGGAPVIGPLTLAASARSTLRRLQPQEPFALQWAKGDGWGRGCGHQGGMLPWVPSSAVGEGRRGGWGR